MTARLAAAVAATALVIPMALAAIAAPASASPSLSMTEFAVPTADAGLGAITAGPDGNLWFLENIDEGNAAQIGKITPGGTVTEYSAGPQISGLDDITAGPGGNLWFTCQNNCGVGSITPSGDVDTNFDVVLGTEDVAGITTGPDGNLWFAYGDEPDIGTMTPGTSGTATNFVVNGGLHNPCCGTWAITAGPDGNLWFTEPNLNEIGVITTSGAVTTYTDPSSLGDGSIVAGPDGNLWFTEPNSNAIASITTSGTITQYPIPSGNSPVGLTAGPDGNLWFTEPSANQIGMITTSGAVTEYPGPDAGGSPVDIATGPDGNLWFTDSAANEIVKINLAPAAPTTTSLSSSPNPSSTGQAVTYTATVTPVAPASGTPTGTVSFADGSAPITGCTAQALSGGTATCTVTYTSTGTHSITATYGGDSNFAPSPPSNTISQLVSDLAPVVTSISPAFGPGTGKTPIGIKGDNFCQATGVNFGSVAAAAFKVGARSNGVCSLRAVSPPGTGLVDVTVTSPGGTSATGSQDQFSYAPVVTSISPAFGPGTGKTPIGIKGDNFCQATGVNFGSVAAAAFKVGARSNGVCSLRAVSPPGTGLVDVTVTSPGGTSATGSQDQFSYAPVVTSISPAFGPGTGKTPIGIKGDNFCQATGVNFGSVAAAAFKVGARSNGVCSLRAVSPPGTGLVDVTVTSPGGTSATGSQDQFSYAPVVTSISPAFGPGTGKTPIGIKGDNFCQATGVNFGSVAAAAFKVGARSNGVCSLRAVSPPGTGLVDVTVTSPGGTSATGSQDQFSYAPVVTSISPAFGPGTGKTPIGIKGDNFCQATGVNFGSVAAAAFKVGARSNGVCSLRAVSPPGTGLVDVTVTSPGGTSATGSQDQFSYQ